MFGMLIVQLPSEYDGGQLRVKHAKKEHIFDFSGLKGSTGFHYAALYADCQHELCTVTRGHRLCLMYNLIHTGPGYSPAPTDNTLLVKRAVEAMKGWIEHPCSYLPMIAIPLEHKYCEASLSFSGVKNKDRAKAGLLKIVSHEVAFGLYQCIVKITQYWSVDCTARDFVGQTIMAEHLVSPSSKKAENVPLDEMMIMPEGALHSVLDNGPDDERLKEATGNDGVTQNR